MTLGEKTIVSSGLRLLALLLYVPHHIRHLGVAHMSVRALIRLSIFTFTVSLFFVLLSFVTIFLAANQRHGAASCITKTLTDIY